MTEDARYRLAVVGLGKIAHDQHLPAVAISADFRLCATASPNEILEGVPGYTDLRALLAAQDEIDAVSLCTMPQVRTELAKVALLQGLHVLLEKPPGATVAEVLALCKLANRQGRTLFASWHSRYSRGAHAAESWLSERRVQRIQINWKEDVRVWHPGQRWLWEHGGLGVFDPGINALSLLTKIMGDASFLVEQATLSYPANCGTPISASLRLSDLEGIPVEMELDFLNKGPQVWNIAIQTDDGELLLGDGGNSLRIDDEPIELAASAEYPQIYAHFARLIREQRSDVDLAPLQLVADAFLCARRIEVAPFIG